MPASGSAPDAWARIERFLAEHLPTLGADLASGASDAALGALVERVGAESSAPFEALYQFHDGQRSPAPGLFFGLQFLSTREAAEEWGRWTALLRDDPALTADIEVASAPAHAVRPVYAAPGWVPFASDGAGNHLAVDLAPGSEGTVGQVISFGVDEAARVVLAPSTAHFLDWCVRRCESGEASVVPDPDAPGGLGLRLTGGRSLLDALPVLFGAA